MTDVNIGFDWSQPSTKRGLVSALIAVALMFGVNIPDGAEQTLLALLFGIQSLLGMFLKDVGAKGEPGSTGAPGAPGPQGPQGPAGTPRAGY